MFENFSVTVNNNKVTFEEIHRLLDCKDADPPKPGFTHDCDRCVFLGHYYTYDKIDELKFYDLYLCINGGPTVIARYGNESSEYASGNNAYFFMHMPELAKAAELAIRYMTKRMLELYDLEPSE